MMQCESPYFAAIDLGSNSFHMLIVRINDNDKIETIDREKQMVQIARGLTSEGILDDNAQQRALECLHRFAERLRDIPPQQIRVVGTKTLRAANNSDKFLTQAEQVIGAKIQIISGYEEARLVYAGLANSISENDQRLVVDIGGGSTEFVIGTSHDPTHLESLALGCVSFTEKYIAHNGGVNKGNMRKAYYEACTELEEIRKNYLKAGWKTAYGTSGTMKAVAEILVEKDGGAVITRASLDKLVEETINNGKIIATNVTKLRRDVLPAGLAILQAIFEQLKLEKIHVASASLKEGLIYDTIGRYSDHDSRVETVKKLKAQYNIDEDQAQRVSTTAGRFWSQIERANLPGVSRTKILYWASQLHEIGLNISHSGYHHHGHYILRHSDLAGFGRYEQYILATLVRLHRKKPHENKIEGLDGTAREAFVPLLVCLRIAALLHRRREDIDDTPALKETYDGFHLSFSKDWLSNHPLTMAGLTQEQSYLKNIGVVLTIDS
ncbi:Ppx/GppA phosphatase family protein [Agarilytica rhodophyticola]|uniref:Ppx/GppA phosphatase family protein n=1 Tax=Agarilytica rhodophyticola TaxID=1737490 RepID=UPI000B345931|nr:Ppx/GppA phosphatase family protein [Agarilytica rhodophyticola]